MMKVKYEIEGKLVHHKNESWDIIGTSIGEVNINDVIKDLPDLKHIKIIIEVGK